MLRRTRRSQRGFTLAEVMMATALIGVLVYATVTISSTGIKLTKSNMDKQFATQKAISMLEEMKALVQVNQGTTITVLDGYDDGTNYRARLTTRGLILTDPPAEPVSCPSRASCHRGQKALALKGDFHGSRGDC